MFDLLMILIAMLMPQLLGPLGVPGDIVAAMQVASLLVWPGYVASLLLWPRGGQLHAGIKLALVPFLSVIIIMFVSLLCWAINISAGLEKIDIIVTLLVAAMLGALMAVRLFRNKYTETASYGEIAGACLMFATLALLVGLSAIGPEPQQASATPSLTIYVDPASSPGYDRATDTWQLPIVVETDNAATATTVALTASVNGHEALSGLISLSPGEETRVSMNIPAHYLAQPDAAPVDIQAHLSGLSSGPALRLWLNRR